MQIIGCINCGSEMLRGKPCPACQGKTKTEYWIDKAVESFLKTEATYHDVEILETQLEIALRDPPEPNWPHIQYG